MEDDELAQIRARRMAQLQSEQQQNLGTDPTASKEPSSQQLDAAQEQRRSVLFQILNPAARERLARISMVKPDKATSIEELLLRMAKSGQLRQKVDENQLVELLGQIAETQQSSKIQFNRRKSECDDED